ncbi:hypothetical protein BGZ65_002342 [Modicella reniformis]|uniref:C2H2-type domain-containing protein n=1 Tax=Modicella reniformis TaxID=1440133 RepID=A0A9P6LSU7_9FUNG|nr:hypothetical protein BGZ65_002342 [Modicella reniformis]
MTGFNAVNAYNNPGRNHGSISTSSRNINQGNRNLPTTEIPVDPGPPLRLGDPGFYSGQDLNSLYAYWDSTYSDGEIDGFGPKEENEGWRHRDKGAKDVVGGETSRSRATANKDMGGWGGTRELVEQRQDRALDSKWKGKGKAKDEQSPFTRFDDGGSTLRTDNRGAISDAGPGTDDSEDDGQDDEDNDAQEGIVAYEEDERAVPSNRVLKGKERANHPSRTDSSPEGGVPDDYSGTAVDGNPPGTRARENKNHQCPECNKRFSRPSQLRTHSFTHSGEMLQEWQHSLQDV